MMNLAELKVEVWTILSVRMALGVVTRKQARQALLEILDENLPEEDE